VNIEQNPGLKDRVHLLPTTQDAPILFPLLPETLVQLGLGPEMRRPVVAFSMCNPPFYSNIEEVARSANGKNADPHAVS
jgi:23S rRNA A1618 N6-methylase RlmF